jgi:toxin ParE1/3/4
MMKRSRTGLSASFLSNIRCARQNAGQGHMRRDLTKGPVLFFPLYSYLIVYQPDADRLRIVALVHAKRNVKRFLKQRST